jgi:iron complex transport system permease protein
MNTLTARHHAVTPPGHANQPMAWLAAALVLSVLVAVQCGAVPVHVSDWLALMAHEPGHSAGAYVLWEVRLPRAWFALTVGASIGLAGALTQGLFRNPLADPGLLGVSAGAACMAALTIVVFSGLAWPLPPSWRPWLLPVSAFVGALAVCLTLDRVARWITPGSIAGLLLTGVALNALAAAVIGLCTYLATDEQLRSLSFWTLGSLAGAQWAVVIAMTAVLAAAAWRARRLARTLNALALGEAAAAHVGIDVDRLRTQVIALVAILAGFSVAWCGMIGFIGLMAPHMVRRWVGADQRLVLPMSMLMGAWLLLLADTLARSVAIPAEVPVGIFTALLGSPFFLLLLRQARGQIA